MSDNKEAAWFLTWTTYGAWLPSDGRGFGTFANKSQIENPRTGVRGLSSPIASETPPSAPSLPAGG